MAATPLRAARELRGWTQDQVIARLRRATNESLPAATSLTRQLSRWENGATVGQFYGRLLCQVFEAPPDALGLSAPLSSTQDARIPELQDRIPFSNPDAELVGIFESQTQNFRLLDRRLGAAHLLPQTEQHVAQMENILRYSMPGSARSAIARALAEASSLTAWQALDSGHLDKAWKHYEIAKSAARECESPAVLAHVTAEQTYTLLDNGYDDEALQLVRHAHQQAPRKLPGLLRAWLFAAEGEALAVVGDGDAARKAMDAAARYLPDDPEDPELPFLMLNETHLARWRGNCLARLGADEALDDLTSALSGIEDGSLGRAEAGLQVDLAMTFQARGEVDEAQKHAQRAAELAGRTGSARQRARIAKLLAP